MHELSAELFTIQLLANILFRAQKETEIAASLNWTDFFYSPPTPCEPDGYLIFVREFFRLASPLLNAREPITVMHRNTIYTVRESRAEAEWRRANGRTGWLGQAQFKHTMKKI
jgi:hypothetical protein